MEKGKLYISKSIKCIVECTKDSSSIDNFFNGNVVKCDSGEYNIGYYSTTWIKDCFTEYIQPATSAHQVSGSYKPGVEKVVGWVENVNYLPSLYHLAWAELIDD